MVGWGGVFLFKKYGFLLQSHTKLKTLIFILLPIGPAGLLTFFAKVTKLKLGGDFLQFQCKSYLAKARLRFASISMQKLPS